MALNVLVGLIVLGGLAVSLRYPPIGIVTLLLAKMVPEMLYDVYFPKITLAIFLGMAFNAALLFSQNRIAVPRRTLFVYLLLIAYGSLSSVMSEYRYREIAAWGVPMMWTFGLLCACQLRTSKDRAIVMWSLIAFSTFLAVWNLSRVESYYSEGFSMTTDRNILGFFTGLGMVSLLAFIIYRVKLYTVVWKAALVGLLLLNFVGLLALASRGSSLAVVGTFGIMVAKRYHKVWQLIGVALLAIWLVPIALELPVFEPLIKRFSERSMESFGRRLPLAIAGVEHLSKRSLLATVFGEGTAACTIVALGGSLGARDSLHNAYLEILVDYGLIGFALFSALIVFAVRQAKKDTSWCSLATTGILTLLLVIGLSFNPFNVVLPWIALGITLAEVPQVGAQTGRPRQMPVSRGRTALPRQLNLPHG